ncbi:hypothetical protein EJB05_17619, partial [Eragrostis curvula]
MSSSSSEDRRRRKRRLADLDADELEEGEYHSSSDTEDYYNRDAALSGESDETISDLDDTTASSAAANHKKRSNNSTASSAAASHSHKSSASAAAANRNGGGGARAYSVLANHYGGARTSLTAANHYGRASASSALANMSFAAAPMRACRVCGKEFSSEKAVCGHMKVHAQEALHGGGKEQQQQGNGGKDKKKVKKERIVAVAAGGWGVTGRRGCSGSSGTSMDIIVKATPNAEPGHHSMDIVPAEPKIVYAPTPMAFAMPEDVPPMPVAPARTNLSGESSSKNPMPNDDMDIAAAGANPIPPTEPVVHQQPAAPPPHAGKQAQVVRHKRAPRPSAGRQNPAGYRCSDPTCNKWYANHQALGGHIAGHKNRQQAAAGGMPHDGAGPSSGGGGSKADEPHPCQICGKVYSKGVQLGGHMRKHYEGKIVPKRKLRTIEPPPPPADVVAEGPAQLCRPADAHADDLTLALPIKAELQSLAPVADAEKEAPSAAAEGTPEPAPARPRATGRVILFGIDIGLGVQTPPAQEGSLATKDSSASTALGY